MCARYVAPEDKATIEKVYHFEVPSSLILPQKLIYPHSSAPVIIEEQGVRVLRLMNYSLIPKWSKVRKPKFATYNARVEDILTKPTWREAFQLRHCLVPVKFFIESVHEGPYAGHNIEISSLDQHVLTGAGIWETWRDLDSGEEIDSFALLTREPPKAIREAGHDRCPVFLEEGQQKAWLGEKHSGKAWLQFLDQVSSPRDWRIHPAEKLKSFKKQMSLFDD